MSPRETQQAVRVLKQHRKKVTSSRRNAREFLVRAGILNKQGTRLSSTYRES